MFGGTYGAFRENTIWRYLKQYNGDPHDFEIATDNFIRSCAGYCVVTFLLGNSVNFIKKFLYETKIFYYWCWIY